MDGLIEHLDERVKRENGSWGRGLGSSGRDERGDARYNFGRRSNQLESLFPEITHGDLYLQRMGPSVNLPKCN